MELETLKKDVADLTAWMNTKKRQQLKYPLDYKSRKVFTAGIGTIDGVVVLSRDGLQSPVYFTDLLGFGLGIHINGRHFYLYAEPQLHKISSVDTGTDTLGSQDGHHNMKAGTRVAFYATNALPGGLSEITTYYVINPSGGDFQVSTTLGGSAVNITDTGLGDIYFGII